LVDLIRAFKKRFPKIVFGWPIKLLMYSHTDMIQPYLGDFYGRDESWHT